MALWRPSFFLFFLGVTRASCIRYRVALVPISSDVLAFWSSMVYWRIIDWNTIIFELGMWLGCGRAGSAYMMMLDVDDDDDK